MLFQANITLNHKKGGRFGAKQIALLEAIGRTGSIAAASREINLSYKAAWDALDSMQDMAHQPLLQKKSGGQGGGGTQLTPTGLRFIKTWHLLQAGFDNLLKQAENDFSSPSLEPKEVNHDFRMRTSARNVFLGEVANIIPLAGQQDENHALLANICLDLGNDLFIHSAITRKSIERLGLSMRCKVHALIKASFVEIVPLEKDTIEKASNKLCGTICDFATDDHYTEITVDLGQARTITATCLHDQATVTGLKQGLAVTAQFSPADVILAAY